MTLKFDELYDRHILEIHRYLAGRLGSELADDLAAETFLTAFRKRDRFDPSRGEVRPWLYGIANNLVSLHRRSESRRLAALRRVPAEQPHSHEERVLTRVMAASAQGQLATALATLSDGERDVLLLVALADLSHEEVGQALGIPFGTVGSRLSRVRKKLRVALGDTNPMLGGTDG
ncbi:RNA polymerase sigma factor [Nonomuraea sp. NPDC050556]|uniref:RNA polymerase sigma factor n=1 Tax=Nonomuraea sp. NPDC050556 TaxID=3364369 RepID=UPI00378B4D3A